MVGARHSMDEQVMIVCHIRLLLYELNPIWIWKISQILGDQIWQFSLVFPASKDWAVSSPYSSKVNSVLDKIGLDNLILIMIVLNCKAFTGFEIQCQFGSSWWKQEVHRILVKLNFFLSFNLNIFGSSESTSSNICYVTLKVSARL